MSKLKLIFAFIIYLIASPGIYAQDTLILNDGTENHVKVMEVGENTISFEKSDNINGPKYTMDLAKVFMVVYKNGKRETFKTSSKNIKQTGFQNVKNIEIPMLHDNSFELHLTESKSTPDKRKKGITITGTVDVYSEQKLFTKITFSAYQITGITIKNSRINAAYLGSSYITMITNSPTLNNVLFEKYENAYGKGLGWALPPDFFSSKPSSCSVTLLEQKKFNKEWGGFAGRLASTQFTLQDCSTLEEKLLSIVLLWLETNFM